MGARQGRLGRVMLAWTPWEGELRSHAVAKLQPVEQVSKAEEFQKPSVSAVGR